MDLNDVNFPTIRMIEQWANRTVDRYPQQGVPTTTPFVIQTRCAVPITFTTDLRSPDYYMSPTTSTLWH